MKKYLLKIISIFFIAASLLCGCSTNNKIVSNKDETTTKEEEKSERASEYGENDKPWGEYNYKNIGVIKNLKKNLDDNFIIAEFIVDGESTKDEVKVYGTDMDISKYEGKKVFISGVKDTNKDKDYVLIKTYEDITLVD